MSSQRLARTTDGQFEATRLLRETPTSCLYAGRHLRMGFGVALKVPKGKQARSIARRELLALRHLQHPNNVRLLGAAQLDVDGHRHPCLVLSLHEDETLREILRVQRRLPAVRAVGLIRQVLGALGEAHARGVAHGDIQPANVLVGTPYGLEDHVTLVDYGAAVSEEIETIERGRQTVYGTPFYTAPEVGVERGPSVQSDVYSVGVLLYEMLSGSRPHLTEERPVPARPATHRAPLREVLPGSYELGEVVDRATATRARDRVQDVAAFANALANLNPDHLLDCNIGANEPSIVQGAEVDTVEVEIPDGEGYVDAELDPAASPSAAERCPLQSAGKPTVWVLTGDEAIERREVREALAALTSTSHVEWLEPAERIDRVMTLRSREVRLPWVVVFGPAHLKTDDPVVTWLAEHTTEVSRMMISTDSTMETLQVAIDRCGLDQHTVVPAEPRAVGLDLRQMIERARALRLHYDGLRVGWRDAREDLQALTHEAWTLTGG